MLLTITTTHTPATDLGYLLGKHPARVQTFPLNFGQAHVFYPEATDTRCTAALLLDIDPIGLVRGDSEWFGRTFALGQYVNDRPYAASSFMSVAIAQVYRNALKGQAKEHAALTQMPIPLQAIITPLPSRGGAALLDRLFTPLGYTLTAERHPLDPHFPAWGESRYYTVTLAHTCRLQDLLAHLYVLIPVLDDEKHYWVGEDEVQKLLAFGGEWLRTHPERDLITTRYLRHRRHLIRTALAQLLEDQPEPEPEETAEEETSLEQRVNLHEQRLGTVLSVLRQSGARRVLDLGCGEGKLLRKLLEDRQFIEIVGMDVSHQTLEIAADRLHLDPVVLNRRLPEKQKERIRLIHGSLMYRDQRLEGFDAAAVVEVIEHLDPPRLAAFARVLFEYARPQTVVLTTPNAEYNIKFQTLPEGKFRHRDHRFEWTRAEFQTWADAVGAQHGYTVRYLPLGPEDPLVGAPSQMAVFTRPA